MMAVQVVMLVLPKSGVQITSNLNQEIVNGLVTAVVILVVEAAVLQTLIRLVLLPLLMAGSDVMVVLPKSGVQITSNLGQVLVNGVGEAAVGLVVEGEETIVMEWQQVASQIVRTIVSQDLGMTVTIGDTVGSITIISILALATMVGCAPLVGTKKVKM